MRVLHTVHAYPPSVGGSEAVVHRLSRGLLDRGHEVTVATSAHPERDGPVDGVPVEAFSTLPSGWRAYRRFVHEGIEQGRWDVVMTYHSKVWTHLALAPFKKVGPRWVYAPTEFTDLGSRNPRHLVYYRTVEPRALRAAKRVMVLTRADEERAVELAGEAVRERVRRVPNGVDAEWWAKGDASDVRERFGLPEDALLVFYAGGLWPHKEVATLVEALGHLPDAHLVAAGPDRGSALDVEERARALGLRERVHLLGPVKREDLRALYHACDVHASASHNEGFGLTFLEAMACSKPVVARKVGVVPELVDEGAAVWVAHDAASFASGILEATEAGGASNAEQARSYDWERVVDQLVALYEEVAS